MDSRLYVNDDILLYALKYSLTRQTSAPISVMNEIIHNIDKISVGNIKKMIQEIESSNEVGFLIYEDTWNGLVKDLTFELKIRDLKSQQSKY